MFACVNEKTQLKRDNSNKYQNFTEWSVCCLDVSVFYGEIFYGYMNEKLYNVSDIRKNISVLIPHKSGLRSDSNPNNKKTFKIL